MTRIVTRAHRPLLCIALLSAIFVCPGAIGAQSEGADAVLARTIAQVERARTTTGAERDRLVTTALDGLTAPLGLEQPWLRDPIVARDFDLALARLQAARVALAPAAPAVDPVVAARELDRILDGPPFKDWSWLALLPAALLPLGLLIQQALDTIWNAMRWPFDRLFELLNRLIGTLFFSPVVFGLAALTIGGLLWLYRRGLRAAIVSQAEVDTDLAVLPMSSAAALAEAQAHANAGDYRAACHFVFFSTLRWLEEQGQVRFVPAATNREYLAQIAAQPGVAAALAPVVGLFDRVWYGQDAAGPADYQALLVASTRVRAAAA